MMQACVCTRVRACVRVRVSDTRSLCVCVCVCVRARVLPKNFNFAQTAGFNISRSFTSSAKPCSVSWRLAGRRLANTLIHNLALLGDCNTAALH